MKRTVLVGGIALSLLAFEAHAGELALRRVMLSSAGVGYFEYAAEVEGAATLGLDVPLDQVDDVLKSLVVLDGAGAVAGVELPGRDATRAAFGNVPFGADALSAPLDFLNSLQGVELVVQGPRPMTGRLLHADAVAEPAAPGADGSPRAVARTRVSLMTGEGLRQFVLEDADSVQVADPGLRARIAEAIAALRRDSGQDARHLTIRLGERAPGATAPAGARTVRVGYIAVAPLWKASYRLVLPPGGPAEATARLQGWATLENASGTDWSGVELTLQYGNPVTFHQAIYRSYFVARPDVPVEVLGRLLPDVDTASRPEPPPPAPAPGGEAQRGMKLAAPAFPYPAAAAPPPSMAMAAPAQTAAATETAEETTFTLPLPVTLAAGHSASVPILDRDIPAARLALARPDQAHPLAAIRVRNPGEASLPAGVLTLYDSAGAATYAGDARLGGLPAGATRLLSFAQDLRTTLEWQHARAVSIATLTAAAGVLRFDERTRQTTRLVITAPPSAARVMLIEIPKGTGQIVAPDGPRPVEETATAWRFAASLASGETRTLTISVDRIERRETVLLGDATTIARVLGEEGLAPPARAALARLEALRAAEAARAGERDALRERLETVEHNEERLRDNLRALSPGDALRSRLVRDLDADETRIAQLRQSIDQSAAAVERAHQELADAVGNLRI